MYLSPHIIRSQGLASLSSLPNMAIKRVGVQTHISKLQIFYYFKGSRFTQESQFHLPILYWLKALPPISLLLSKLKPTVCSYYILVEYTSRLLAIRFVSLTFYLWVLALFCDLGIYFTFFWDWWFYFCYGCCILCSISTHT